MKDWANPSHRGAALAAWRLVFLMLFGLAAPVGAQPALEFFTNQANALLQAQFGFGLTNIPLYSMTNPSNGNSAAIHYMLQAAANDYDATNLSSVFPSVFRPQFAWQSNGLWIVGYTNVVADFDAQLARGFKQINDPSIGLNDNVWGVPWVVGAKNNPPNFNEYSYTTVFSITRRILMTRPATNVPPAFTNQSYEMSLSNVFGAEAWNSSHNALTNSVSIIVTNLVSILFTNNYSWGTNFSFMTGTNWPISSWPGWNGADYPYPGNFLVPFLTTVVPLADSFWSEMPAQFSPASGYPPFPAAGDSRQMAWPVHAWTVQITNQLMYALVDTSTGTNHLLDFVNLGGFGSVLDVNQVLNQGGLLPPPIVTGPVSYAVVWQTNGATDDPLTSPMSSGMLAQIEIAAGIIHVSDWPPRSFISNQISNFFAVLQGRGEGLSIETPFDPTATLVQSCSWQAATPWVHYTLEDLTNAPYAEPPIEEIIPLIPEVAPPISVGSIGRINPCYQSITVTNVRADAADGDFSLSFKGFKNMPFAIWASSDLLNWGFLGTALQPAPGQFQFSDPASTNDPARFYQLRLP